MIIFKLLRFFTGYVVFRAYGGFGERFINLCGANGIPLWDISSDSDNIYASTTIGGYKKIISCARKSGMKTRMIKKTGLPFLLFRFRDRSGIAIGAAVMILTLSVLSGRIWLIDVSGNVSVPDEDIIAAINDAGIRIGSKRSSFNAAQCAITAESNFDVISRISVNIKGSRAQITVKENPDKPEITDNSGYYNVVSTADAQVAVLETYSGTVQAKLFDSVMKGQTLISGINQNKDETVSYVHAHGYAAGRTEKEIKSEMLINRQLYSIKKIKKVYHIYFLGKKITLGKTPPNFDFEFDSEKYLSLKGKRMPFGLFYTEYSQIDENEKQLSENEMRLTCISDFADEAEIYCASRQVIKIETSDESGKDKALIKGNFVCYENIGAEMPFEVTEIQ